MKLEKSYLTVFKLARLGGACHDRVLKGDFTARDCNCPAVVQLEILLECFGLICSFHFLWDFMFSTVTLLNLNGRWPFGLWTPKNKFLGGRKVDSFSIWVNSRGNIQIGGQENAARYLNQYQEKWFIEDQGLILWPDKEGAHISTYVARWEEWRKLKLDYKL